MECKIGEIFEYNGEWYQCIVGNGCENCAFYERKCYTIIDNNLPTGNCCANRRKDNKDVIFKKLEKVGEQFLYRGKQMQSYKRATDELICNWNNDLLLLEHGDSDIIDIEIKQNKEDMEEKKDNYDGNMDKECIQICDVLNSISDVRTTESCCGHCKDRFMVFFTCDNPHSLAIIARVFDRRYISTSQPWYIELQTKDSGAYDYFIHSETKYDSEEVMMKDINQIIENIKYWCDDKFASHFKGCDDNPTLAPFDINLAKQGKPVCTRDGRKARIICFDLQSIEKTLIVAAVQVTDKQEVISHYYEDGRQFVDGISELDLMMLPEKKEGWVNVYYDNDASSHRGCRFIYDTKEQAVKGAGSAYITTVRINWEE